jgi:predicted secreted protein
MSGFLGRHIIFEWGGDGPLAVVPGVQEKAITCDGAPVDVSGDDSSGWRELLDEDGENSVNISLSGVTKSSMLRNAWFNGSRSGETRITYPDGGVIEGVFRMTNYNETGNYKEAVTFETELQSSGVVTYTPPGPGA